MTTTAAAVSGFWTQLSAKWQALGAMGGALTLGITIGAFGMGWFGTPAIAQANQERLDSVMPLAVRNYQATLRLEDEITALEEEVEGLDSKMDALLVGQCLTLAELRAQVTDRCRLILADGSGMDE